MGDQRELWIRIGLSVILSAVALSLLSWYLERQESALARQTEPLREAPLPDLHYLASLPGARWGLPLRDLSRAERLELVVLPPGASVSDRPCLVDLRPEGLFLRKPEQAMARIWLRSPPLEDLAPMQRAWLLCALEELLADWDRDPSELDLPPGEAFRTLALWMHRDPFPWARR